MSDELYQLAIKELARAAHGAGRLAQPTASARIDNPLCGDRVTLDLRIQAGIVVELAHETRGCLLCRAAASLLAREIPGRRIEDLALTKNALEALLQAHTKKTGIWPELAIFAPVQPHKSRHGCVLLPFRALQQAIEGYTPSVAG
jgi:NifU-like protein involved in Fe-S cluster formation